MPLTGKQRAQRISRAYHSLPDPNIFWKRVFGLVGLTIGLLYAGWLFSAPAKRQISTGELSKAHSHLGQSDCEKCHVAYTPIRSDALWGTHPDIVKINNNTCNGSCHQERNKHVVDHFGSKTKPEVLAQESCSGCHQEHLGKDRNLNEVANSQCTRCHADLSISSLSNPPHVVATNFNKEHPILPFENPVPPGGNKPDPQTVKFSHIQHMRPGQPKTPGDRTAMKLEDITKIFREKYRSSVDQDGFIQLTCSNCHERDNPIRGLDGLEDNPPKIPASFEKPNSEHMLYKPIDYETHCVACHAIEENLDAGPPLTHGLNKEQTIEEIRKRRVALSSEEVQKALESADPTEKLKRRQQETEDIFEKELPEVARQCVKCHEQNPESQPIDLVVRPNIQVRWLDNASFNHGKHLMIGCIACHKEPYDHSESKVNSEVEAERIMIGGLAKCRECHIEDAVDRAKAGETNANIATANCMECHRYHVDPGNKPHDEQKTEDSNKPQETTSVNRPWATLSARLQRPQEDVLSQRSSQP
jgi:hypothetical protein